MKTFCVLLPRTVLSTITRSSTAPKKLQSSNEGDGNSKKILKKISIELKREVVERHGCGVLGTDLALKHTMGKSTVLKNKDAIKGDGVAE